MATDTASGVHLPSLSISSFRGIKRLRIPRLGHPAALFHGRTVPQESGILIGPNDGRVADMLSIRAVSPNDEQIELLGDLCQDDSFEPLVMQVAFGKGKRVMPWCLPPATYGERKAMSPSSQYRYARRRNGDADLPPPLSVDWLGAGVVSNRQLADMWEDVVLTQAEDRATRALAMVVGDSVDRVAMVGSTKRMRGEPHVSVRLRDQATPVPLRSLGNGAVRIFAVALALANASGGFLLIDEAEDGIHHKVHQGFWRMILQAARESNVQVLATTHSFSCVRGFALACAESAGQGIYVRLERRAGETKAVTYTEDELEIVAEQGIEVR